MKRILMPCHLDRKHFFFSLTILASIVCCSLQKLPPQLVVILISCKVNAKTRFIMLLIEDALCKLQISNLDAKHVELPSEQVAYLN